MSRLVLIGGPPGVGKTSLLRRLPERFDSCACLDADDVWRVRPTAVDDPLRAIALRNVTAVLRGYLEARFELVFVGWVFARREMIEAVLEGARGLHASQLIVHLMATPPELEARSSEKLERGLKREYQQLKVRQIEALPFAKIDTTGLDPAQVAERLAALIGNPKLPPVTD